MPAPSGPRQISTRTSPARSRSGPWLLIAAIAARPRVNTRAGPAAGATAPGPPPPRAPPPPPPPPVEEPAGRVARHAQAALVEQPQPAQVQHDLGDAAREEGAHGRGRAVRQRVHA